MVNITLQPAEEQIIELLTSPEKPDKMSVGELEEEIPKSRQTISGVTKELAEKGLIRRERSQEDRRKWMCSIAPDFKGEVSRILSRHEDSQRIQETEKENIVTELADIPEGRFRATVYRTPSESVTLDKSVEIGDKEVKLAEALKQVLDHLNMQREEYVIDKMKDFWRKEMEENRDLIRSEIRTNMSEIIEAFVQDCKEPVTFENQDSLADFELNIAEYSGYIPEYALLAECPEVYQEVNDGEEVPPEFKGVNPWKNPRGDTIVPSDEVKLELNETERNFLDILYDKAADLMGDQLYVGFTGRMGSGAVLKEEADIE